MYGASEPPFMVMHQIKFISYFQFKALFVIMRVDLQKLTHFTKTILY